MVRRFTYRLVRICICSRGNPGYPTSLCQALSSTEHPAPGLTWDDILITAVNTTNSLWTVAIDAVPHLRTLNNHRDCGAQLLCEISGCWVRREVITLQYSVGHASSGHRQERHNIGIG